MIESLTATYRAFTGTINKTMTFLFTEGSHVIRNIDGLGSVKASLNGLDVPEEAGGEFLSSYTPTRNIVITIGFDPVYSDGETVTDLRNELYSIFPVGFEVDLDFETTHKGLMKIKGVVESNQPDMFSQNPQNQISIICYDPYFRSDGGIVTVPYNLTVLPGAAFEYTGEVETGFTIEFSVSSVSGLPNLAFRKNDVYGSTNFGLYYTKAVGDFVTISSVRNDKKVTYVRSAATVNALGFFRGSLTKLKLVPGENRISTSNAAQIGSEVIKYEPLYAGI